jgi:hypothetical protein
MLAAASQRKGDAMPENDELMVWSSMLDNKFTVQVARAAPYRGELTITDGEKTPHREPVGLSFDALFGPDVADVAEWQEIAIAFVEQTSAVVTSKRAASHIERGARRQRFTGKEKHEPK